MYEDDIKLLLTNIKSNLSSLEELLATISGHWTYEDYVYRFYHQSFKVYFCQADTEKICSALKALLPHREFHPFFMKIVEEGTSQSFSLARSNNNWLVETRPIIEAFLHAKFMLEAVVKYGKNPDSDEMLSSGWATLLHLYGIR